MGLAEWLFDGVKSTIEVRGDIDRLTAEMAAASNQLLDHEKRLIRIETMIEMSQFRSGGRPQLSEG
jgi:hypothetical protein